MLNTSNTSTKSVKGKDNPLRYKQLIKMIHFISLKMFAIRKEMKVTDDTFSVLIVLMECYANRNGGLTRWEIYKGCGFKTVSSYTLLRKRLMELVNRGLIEVIGKRRASFVYIPTKSCIDGFTPLIGADGAQSLTMFLATA